MSQLPEEGWLYNDRTGRKKQFWLADGSFLAHWRAQRVNASDGLRWRGFGPHFHQLVQPWGVRIMAPSQDKNHFHLCVYIQSKQKSAIKMPRLANCAETTASLCWCSFSLGAEHCPVPLTSYQVKLELDLENSFLKHSYFAIYILV